MDINGIGKEVSQDLARESLISISYSLPDKALDSDEVIEPLNGEKNVQVVNVKDDGDEKYRSELISISDCPCPETKASPPSPSPPSP